MILIHQGAMMRIQCDAIAAAISLTLEVVEQLQRDALAQRRIDEQVKFLRAQHGREA